MMRLNFSLRTLLLVVAYIAAACATLRYPNKWVADAWLIATPLILLLAILSAIIRQAERRAFWIGFAIFGWGYLLLSYLDGEQVMITDRLLRQCYFKLYEEKQEDIDPFAEQASNNIRTSSRDFVAVIRVPPVFVLAQWVPPNTPRPATERWRPRRDIYIALGQSIFTLLIAWLGGQLGKFMALSENSRKGSPPG